VNTILEETLSAMRVVKSFAREPYETQRFNTGVEEAFSIAMKRTGYAGFFPQAVIYDQIALKSSDMISTSIWL
jgi:ABC-type multidrug transport system fused ATPase/permease subunit